MATHPLFRGSHDTFHFATLTGTRKLHPYCIFLLLCFSLCSTVILNEFQPGSIAFHVASCEDRAIGGSYAIDAARGCSRTSRRRTSDHDFRSPLPRLSSPCSGLSGGCPYHGVSGKASCGKSGSSGTI